jgi:hypothetical protein
LFNKHVHGKSTNNRYAFYETDEYWKYVDAYCEFVKANIDAIDHYANVDVIHNPELSWKTLKYIEKEHGLNPVPVIHMGTHTEWLRKHMEEGYDLIGVGGMALGSTRTIYRAWADRIFNVVCDTPDKTPQVKIHGFACTSYQVLVRYPWWSVDSTSWAKAGGFGIVYYPRKVNGEFGFVAPPTKRLQKSRQSDYTPYNLSCSTAAPAATKKHQSILSISAAARRVLMEWLELIDVPYGTVDDDGEMVEWGIISHHAARKIANLRFFEHLVAALPDWPWPFQAAITKGFGFV